MKKNDILNDDGDIIRNKFGDKTINNYNDLEIICNDKGTQFAEALLGKK